MKKITVAEMKALLNKIPDHYTFIIPIEREMFVSVGEIYQDDILKCIQLHPNEDLELSSSKCKEPVDFLNEAIKKINTLSNHCNITCHPIEMKEGKCECYNQTKTY